MKRSKTLKLFLIDGEPSGRIKCSITNWIGLVYKIPRNAIDKAAEIKELKNSGVYFLFGTSYRIGEDDFDNNVVYVGQAVSRKNGHGLLQRVKENHPSITDWTEVLMLTTVNNAFGSTEISYLEHRFYNLAQISGRCNVRNSNDPNLGNVTEETESELEEFIDYARICIGTLGYRLLFAPAEGADDSEPTLYLEYNGAKATGKRNSDGFVVFKGSQITPNTTLKCPKSVLKDREKHADKIDENNVLQSDIFFSSPSGAACFVGGAPLSGNALWHDSNGKKLKELDNNE